MDSFGRGMACGLFFGLLIAFFAAVITAAIVDGRLLDCRDAALKGLPIGWQETTPYCGVLVEINGNETIVAVEDYYKYGGK